LIKCASCQKTGVNFKCGICGSDLCKACVEIINEDQFSFLEIIPADLCHTSYCDSCYQEKVHYEIQSYNSIIEQAKNVSVYDKTQGKETRWMSRKEKPIRINNCLDKEEALLRLAFLTVKRNFNTLIDVEVAFKKEKINGYQRSIWTATGIPVQI